MSLTKKDLDKVIRLSYLEIDDDEKEAYLGQLQKVVDNMDCLRLLDLTDVSPSSWANEARTPQREDRVRKFPINALEDNAPHWENGAFSVPDILGKE